MLGNKNYPLIIMTQKKKLKKQLKACTEHSKVFSQLKRLDISIKKEFIFLIYLCFIQINNIYCYFSFYCLTKLHKICTI